MLLTKRVLFQLNNTESLNNRLVISNSNRCKTPHCLKPLFALALTCLCLLLTSTSTSALATYADLVQESNVQTEATQEAAGKKYTNPVTANHSFPSHLSDKFYRQALYYYFQSQPNKALQQLDINDYYFSDVPTHNSLFKAGLQISQGLPEHAQKLLVQVSENLVKGEQQANSDHQLIQSQLKKEALMNVVLLQLAEQKIAQQDLVGAQILLNKLKDLPQQHLQQYYLLQQLIAWPNQPKIEALPLRDISKKQLTTILNAPSSSEEPKAPYVVLNTAISAMHQQEYAIAEQKLLQLMTQSTTAKTTDFWQNLFGNRAIENSQKINNPNKIEQTGLKNYAHLLLSQTFIEQGLYLNAYKQLESFPKNTAFSEQALFLFGYSAFKLKKFNVSEVVLNALLKNYPYSTFIQQTLMLSVKQYIEQNKLNRALEQLLFIEQYYTDKQHALVTYKKAISSKDDLLTFYQNNNVNSAEFSLWVNTSLKHTNIALTYQQLLSTYVLSQQLTEQTNRNTWIANTLYLNNVRQQKIKDSYQANHYKSTLQLLNHKKEKLKGLLAKAKSNKAGNTVYLGNSEIFADKVERQLLTRINNSKTALTFINENSDKNTQEYNQRLERVNGVLAWQLQQTFPERYWKSTQQLNEMDKLISTTEKQYKRTSAIVLQQTSLPNLQSKHNNIAENIDNSVNKTQQLYNKLTAQLLQQNYTFIDNETQKIEQFLLVNQHTMASVLESLNKQEAL